MPLDAGGQGYPCSHPVQIPNTATLLLLETGGSDVSHCFHLVSEFQSNHQIESVEFNGSPFALHPIHEQTSVYARGTRTLQSV